MQSIHTGSLSFKLRFAYVRGDTNHYICVKFDSSSFKNGLRNAEKVQVINKVIMCIFNDVQ